MATITFYRYDVADLKLGHYRQLPGSNVSRNAPRPHTLLRNVSCNGLSAGSGFLVGSSLNRLSQKSNVFCNISLSAICWICVAGLRHSASMAHTPHVQFL